ncbi:MAG: hypothetical protein CM1200mP22_23760 [Dehalococcoidia bacterium]|nr:MAG: hypothetical protein CM1200mP22_23760 [Dehalococcoidia bacterium]
MIGRFKANYSWRFHEKVEIDRSKRLKDDLGKGHNRWHPDITPIIEVDLDEEVSLETRDASDGQMNPSVTVW